MPLAPSLSYAFACATASAVEVEATPAITARGLSRPQSWLHDARALRLAEIGELAGRAQRRQPVHT